MNSLCMVGLGLTILTCNFRVTKVHILIDWKLFPIWLVKLYNNTVVLCNVWNLYINSIYCTVHLFIGIHFVNIPHTILRSELLIISLACMCNRLEIVFWFYKNDRAWNDVQKLAGKMSEIFRSLFEYRNPLWIHS